MQIKSLNKQRYLEEEYYEDCYKETVISEFKKIKV